MGDIAKSGDADDSAELEALFDSIAAGAAAPVAVNPDPSGDSGELQALFDSVAAQTTMLSDDQCEGSSQDRVFNRLGHMARQLHDTLRELGYDKMLENAATQIPDPGGE